VRTTAMHNSVTPIRVLSIIEAITVSGPARLLLDFCQVSRISEVQPAVSTSLATFVRGAAESGSNQFLEAVSAQGFKVHRIHERWAFDPRAITGLRRLSRELSPDLVETHGTKSHFLMCLSGIWRTCPWIAFHHGYTMDAKRTQLYNQLDRWSLRAPAAVVTVCEAFRRQLVRRGVSSPCITVLHNAVSPDWLHGAHNDNGASPGAIAAGMPGQHTIIAVGRLSKEKAYVDLVSAMDHLRRLDPQLPVRLIVLGDGPERPALERAVHSLRLSDRVLLLGHVSDVRPYFRIADALAISSVSEGEPMVLLEAMAAGVPVAATSVGGIPDVLTDRQTGLLVAPRNPMAMAEALIKLLHDKGLSSLLAQAAQQRIKSCFSTEARSRFLAQLYERVLRNGHRYRGKAAVAFEKAK
jgi:glycosyltransferase involved in cell wall biosynthesis